MSIGSRYLSYDRDAFVSSNFKIVSERPSYLILHMFKCGIKAMEPGTAPELSRLRLASCPLWILVTDYSKGFVVWLD